MGARLREKLTYANVVATIALFAALSGGVAWALSNDSVKSKHIKDGQVKLRDLNRAAVPQGFTYSAATGDDIQVSVLDTGDYEITAECASVSGRPSLAFFLKFPEDGRLQGFGVVDPTNAPGVGSSGGGVDIDASTAFDSGPLTADTGEAQNFGTTFTYVGASLSATVNLHAVADDDDDLCRLNGTLVPGIIPPS
jgi:hypothetical protein